jgi:hypothetical protein
VPAETPAKGWTGLDIFVPLGSILQAKKKTPALRKAAFLARTKAVHAPPLQPTKVLFPSKNIAFPREKLSCSRHGFPHGSLGSDETMEERPNSRFPGNSASKDDRTAEITEVRSAGSYKVDRGKLQ